nr:MAG TPA: ATP-dependent Clp protease ATP-binding subunit [Caudoviricetes sp.]
MCRHSYCEIVEDQYCDKRLMYRTLKIKRTCIFCGRTEREVRHVKDPPKRKLPYFGKQLK